MDYENFPLGSPDLDDSSIHSYRFPTKSIRFYPVEIQKLQEDNHQINDSSSLYSLIHGSTNLNERVSIAPSIPLSSSHNLIHRRNYAFLGGCSLKPSSQKRFSSLKIPTENAMFTDSFKCKHRHHCNDDTDFNSSNLVIGLEVSYEPDELDTRRTMQYCHFDNNPGDRKDRSVMIALKFNDIRAVIQAHGHLDGCSQFVKVDLGIGDCAGEANRNASAAPKGKRFSCVLTSTFPCKPAHPNQCVVFGKLCSITKLESAVQDYYYSSSCQQGISWKSDKESGKLKFLQGHIFVSICSGDYDWEVVARRQSARLQSTSDGISLFERRLQAVERSDKGENVIFIESLDGQKFSCNFHTIKSKSFTLAEMIEMHAQPFSSGKLESQIVSMEELKSEAVSALISYLNDFPLKEYGIMMISCSTAISLIEVGRKYKIHNLERYICQLIIEEKDASWFDIKSLVKLFQLCHSVDLEYTEKLKFKVVQTFQMKRREDDIEGCLERLFQESPELAAELLMEALSICSKGQANYVYAFVK